MEEEESEDEEEKEKPWEEESSAPGSQTVTGQAENMRCKICSKTLISNLHLLHIAERLPKSVRRPPTKTILLSWSFTWFDRAIEMRVMPPMR